MENNVIDKFNKKIVGNNHLKHKTITNLHTMSKRDIEQYKKYNALLSRVLISECCVCDEALYIDFVAYEKWLKNGRY